jgi:uncharacterized metal-binding protein
MIDEKARVVIVPCSGIGKAFGSVSREAAYEVCDELRPHATRLLALSKLVIGEPEARDRIRTAPAVTIEGCKLMCAAKLVEQTGGTFLRQVAVLDVYREHTDLKPEGIAELNDAGRQLARLVADEIVKTIDRGAGPGTTGEGSHAEVA